MHRLLYMLAFVAVTVMQGCDHGPDHPRTANPATDTLAIKGVVRSLYKWHFTDTSYTEMIPVSAAGDSLYTGFDTVLHRRRIADLTSTGLFSKNFIAGYDRMVRGIDSDLRTKKIEWRVGEVPPFGNDANPWCNCQDSPDLNPWDSVVVNISKMTTDSALLSWTWSNPAWAKQFSYNIKMIQDSGRWYIDKMEGFDGYGIDP